MSLTLDAGFHKLPIAEVRRETADSVSLAFAVPEALRPAFQFVPGQFLTLRAARDGVELRRCYSICSGLDDGELRVAVKRVPGGAFSELAHDGLRAGDTLEVMPPQGRFLHAPRFPGGVYAAFAAGSGITPVLSIIRSVLSREPDSRVFLFYGNRTTAGIMFREALEDLKDRFLGRLSVFHVLSGEQQDLAVLNGRLDVEKSTVLLRHCTDPAKLAGVFVCGPSGMIEAVRQAAAAVGVADALVHTELFTVTQEGPRRAALAVPQEATPSAIASVIFNGVRTDLKMAAGEAVIDAAIRAGLDLPYSCKGGMCCTCRARLLDGEVSMAANYSLEQWELDAGFVLTCQARPNTPRVTLDYDQV